MAAQVDLDAALKFAISIAKEVGERGWVSANPRLARSSATASSAAWPLTLARNRRSTRLTYVIATLRESSQQLVTECDKQVEDFLVGKIKAQYPDHKLCARSLER